MSGWIEVRILPLSVLSGTSTEKPEVGTPGCAQGSQLEPVPVPMSSPLPHATYFLLW